MKKLILIILIAFSFSAEWWIGNHNPNGKTGLISIRTSLFDKLNYTEYHELDLVEYTIPLTDFITMRYSILSNAVWYDSAPGSGGDWYESTTRNRVHYLHVPLYELW